jgi:hypothetical protein
MSKSSNQHQDMMACGHVAAACVDLPLSERASFRLSWREKQPKRFSSQPQNDRRGRRIAGRRQQLGGRQCVVCYISCQLHLNNYGRAHAL